MFLKNDFKMHFIAYRTTDSRFLRHFLVHLIAQKGFLHTPNVIFAKLEIYINSSSDYFNRGHPLLSEKLVFHSGMVKKANNILCPLQGSMNKLLFRVNPILLLRLLHGRHLNMRQLILPAHNLWPSKK